MTHAMQRNLLLACLLLFPAMLFGQTQAIDASLLEAAKASDVSTVRGLLDQGAEVNVRDQPGMTPLLWAGNYGNTDVAQLLLKSGANLNATDLQGWTPLMWALVGSH